MKFINIETVRQRVFNGLAIAGAAMLVGSGLLAVFGERAVPTAFAQADAFLSRRIDGLEQRFFSIESRLSRLEQQSRPVGITSPRITVTNQGEIQYLRTQIDSMRLRVGELECGLLRVDERTLTGAARSARTKLGPHESDKCRSDSATPIQLSARP